MVEMTSPRKLAFHRDKLDAFLRGERVFPASIELDITTKCSRGCRECPSARREEAQALDLAFLDRLFGALQGQTRGMLISGGEPTLSPDFPQALRLARERGVDEIAVVTNGSHLDDPRVADALAEHAAAVRVSLYDWDEELPGSAGGVLRRIARLRNRLDATGSPLAIGVSALTNRERAPRLGRVAAAVASAGAHWLYFHPMCEGWGSGRLAREDQTGVLAAIAAARSGAPPGFQVHHGHERYDNGALAFDEYYAAHFLLVLGADGRNYVGTETKYHPGYVLADLSGRRWRDDFLWQPERLARIRAFNDRTYPPAGGRHRALLYNDFVQRLVEGREIPGSPGDGFLYPHVL